MKIALRILLVLSGVAVAIVLLFAIVFRDRRPQIYFAVEKGDTNFIARHLASGNDVNQLIPSSPFGQPSVPLIDVAIQHGQAETVEFLLQHGAQANQLDGRGETPLMWAMGHVKNEVKDETKSNMIRMLLTSGANPNLRAASEYGWTPLMHAAAYGSSNVVRALLRAGANVNATNNNGQTALHLTTDGNTARLLLDAGADPAIRTPDGKSPTVMDILDGVLTNFEKKTNRVR